MSQQNMISFSIPDNDLADVKAAIAVLKSKLVPHLKTLSPAERMEIPKMGDKTVAFVQKACEHCEQNPDLRPPFLDFQEFKNDVTAIAAIRSIYSPLSEIIDSLDDTLMLAGSDAYAASLIFYQTAKNAQKSDIHAAKTVYNDLSGRFPGRPKGSLASGAEAKAAK
jgi:hypothetical protein